MRQALLGSTACSLMLLLSACGGGGGGGGVDSAPPAPVAPTQPPAPPPPPPPAPAPTPPPPPPPPPAAPTNYDTPEYQSSNAALISGALAAYNSGATGRGIKAAVIDSGINPNLSEFAGKIDPASRDVTLSNRALADEDGHGTAVAAVIAASRDGKVIHGVAFDSTIIALRADTEGSCATTGDDGGCKFGDSSIARGVDAAVAAGARVINLSLGGSAPGSLLLSAMNRAVSAGIVLVISAGNDGKDPEKGANADQFAAVPASRFPTNVIIAGSVGVRDSSGTLTSTDQLSDFSNRAGASANNFLGAFGTGVRTVDHLGATVRYSGTSFAAPTISGAVALLASAFPNLTGAQIVSILFQSADDLGTAGVDSTYGRGRLNIGRAMQPIGTMALAGSGAPVTGSSSDAPGAAGDATSKGSVGAIILDGYSRAFAVDLARTIRTAPTTEPLRRALDGSVKVGGAQAGRFSIAMTVAERRNATGTLVDRTDIGPEDLRKARLIAGSAVARIDNKTAIAMGFAEGAKAMERRLSGADVGSFLIARDVAGNPGFDARRGGALALRRNLGPVGLTLSGEEGEVHNEIRTSATGSPYRWTAMALDRDFGRTWVSLGLGRLEEKRTLLGGRLGAALGGTGAAGTNFLDLEARHELGAGWTAGASARRGWTRFAGGAFTSGAYGVDLARTGLLREGDRLGFRLSQPLRIDGGGFALSLPTSFNYDSMTPGYSLVRSGLTPKGREIDAEVSYNTRLLGTGWLGGNLYVRRQPGHIAAADADVGAAVRFSLGF